MQEERVRRMMFDRVGALEDAENIQLNDEETPETRAVEDALQIEVPDSSPLSSAAEEPAR